MLRDFVSSHIEVWMSVANPSDNFPSFTVLEVNQLQLPLAKRYIPYRARAS